MNQFVVGLICDVLNPSSFVYDGAAAVASEHGGGGGGCSNEHALVSMLACCILFVFCFFKAYH